MVNTRGLYTLFHNRSTPVVARLVRKPQQHGRLHGRTHCTNGTMSCKDEHHLVPARTLLPSRYVHNLPPKPRCTCQRCLQLPQRRLQEGASPLVESGVGQKLHRTRRETQTGHKPRPPLFFATYVSSLGALFSGIRRAEVAKPWHGWVVGANLNALAAREIILCDQLCETVTAQSESAIHHLVPEAVTDGDWECRQPYRGGSRFDTSHQRP
jgi:hypothetical protein